MNFYKFIYFGFYRIHLKLPDPETAEFMAFISLGILVGLNLMSILIGLNFRYYEYFGSAWVYGALFMLPIITINYYYLHRNEKNRELRKIIQRVNLEKLHPSEKAALIYLVASLIAPFIGRIIR